MISKGPLSEAYCAARAWSALRAAKLVEGMGAQMITFRSDSLWYDRRLRDGKSGR